MESHDLFDYMQSAARNLQEEYERIQKRASEDPSTAGDNGEENWAELLEKWLPQKYKIVTKGRVMNADGKCSPQMDVIVLSPNYPNALLGRKEYLEGGVVACFECKLTLKTSHVSESVEAAKILSNLSSRDKEGSPYKELNSGIWYGLLSHSHSWSEDESTPIENIEKKLYDETQSKADHPRELIDLICVSDLAYWDCHKSVFAGPRMIDAMEVRFENLYPQNLEQIKEWGGVVEAGFMCYSEENEISTNKEEDISPIGSLLSSLFVKFAWEDESLREMANYFVSTGVAGPARGGTVVWPISVFSDDVESRLKTGRYQDSDGRWSEWGIRF